MRISPAGLATLAADAHLRLQTGAARTTAIAALIAEADAHAECVGSVVAVELNQNELDALVMLCFDLGPRSFMRSEVVARLNAGARRPAADAFLRCGGDTARRRRERARFLAAVEAKDPLAGYTAVERRLIREYDRVSRSGAQEERWLALRAQLAEQRKRIWRAAQASGWNVANRAERYRSLLARTS